jgi:hypothetical protein
MVGIPNFEYIPYSAISFKYCSKFKLIRESVSNLNGEEEEIIQLLRKELEKRFQVDNVKPKFDQNGNFIGFTYGCAKEDHQIKAREIDRFLKGLGLINIDYIR